MHMVGRHSSWKALCLGLVVVVGFTGSAGRIWVDIGTEEWRGSQETVEDARLLRDALVSEGWRLDKDLRYVEVPGAVHTESAWAERFGDTLQYLYPVR